MSRTYADGRTYTDKELARRRWLQMIYRCTRPGHPAYKNYGGRGIEVCQEWLDFETYLSDVGAAPEGMSLDRIDNDGNYEPTNVRWATRKQQRANRRGYTHCHRGHELTPENTYVSPSTGKRRCRTCKAQWQRDSRRAAARRAIQEKEQTQ